MLRNSGNLTAALAAAQNIASTLLKIQEEAEKLEPTQEIVVLGRRMTAGEVIEIIGNTRFVVTDSDFSANGGVGAAERGFNGSPNWSYYDFRYFQGANGYASPNYPNNEGLNGIILHELAHLSGAGDSFRLMSEQTYSKRSEGEYDGYVGSALWINNEKYANDLTKALAGMASLAVDPFSPTYGYGAVSPTSIP